MDAERRIMCAEFIRLLHVHDKSPIGFRRRRRWRTRAGIQHNAPQRELAIRLLLITVASGFGLALVLRPKTAIAKN